MREEKKPQRKSFLCPFCKRRQTLLAVTWELTQAQALMHFNSCVPPDVERDTTAIVTAASTVADNLSE